MQESLRGYAAAVLETVDDQVLDPVAAQLHQLSQALNTSGDLRDVLTDTALPVVLRAQVVGDLLGQAQPACRRLAEAAVRLEVPGELPPALDWLVTRTESEADRRAGRLEPDLPGGRTATNERLEGYALALLGSEPDGRVIDEVEDQLFRVARLIEANSELADTLGDVDLPVSLRQGIVTDLLAERAEPVTTSLVRYVVAQSRSQLVGHLDWLVDQVAAERGRRVADVVSAVDLDEDQRNRLTQALSAQMGRSVTLRVSVDPALLGGLTVTVGDTVLDGSIRRRFEALRSALGGRIPTGDQASRQRTGNEVERHP